MTFLNAENDGNYFNQLQGNIGINKNQNDSQNNLLIGDYNLSSFNGDALSD